MQNVSSLTYSNRGDGKDKNNIFQFQVYSQMVNQDGGGANPQIVSLLSFSWIVQRDGFGLENVMRKI